MAKERKTLKVRLPLFSTPKTKWRKEIYHVVSEALSKKNIHYTPEDQLEIWITLYFEDLKIRFVDVDNRAKDVMDALQGLIGGYRKKKRVLKPIIPNDSQVYRIVVDKAIAPRQSHGKGHLTIRRYKGYDISIKVGRYPAFKGKKYIKNDG